MNLVHRWLCGTARWRRTVRESILPWALEGTPLAGSLPAGRVLEIGPGPGASTELLVERAADLTCMEVDPDLAAALAARFAGRCVVVRCDDATAMREADGSFDHVVCFTMLHHVPSSALQDRLFREVRRVLRVGGVFAGADTRASVPLRLLHVGDTYVPVDPATLAERLRAAGFREARVDVRTHAFRFRAVR